jgi:hypothetical protein
LLDTSLKRVAFCPYVSQILSKPKDQPIADAVAPMLAVPERMDTAVSFLDDGILTVVTIDTEEI